MTFYKISLQDPVWPEHFQHFNRSNLESVHPKPLVKFERFIIEERLIYHPQKNVIARNCNNDSDLNKRINKQNHPDMEMTDRPIPRSHEKVLVCCLHVSFDTIVWFIGSLLKANLGYTGVELEVYTGLGHRTAICPQ